MATSMLQSLSRMNVHATLGDGEMLVLKTSLEYGEGQPVEIRVRRRGNRFDIDDGRGAIELAGRPPGWIEAAHGVIEELGMNVNRGGLVFVQGFVGRDIEGLAKKLAHSSVAVYASVLELDPALSKR